MVFNKDICIICMENCNEKICECNAFIHKSCLKKWNESIYNVDQETCPHCRREIILKEKCYKKILNDICKCLNTMYNYFITFIHGATRLFEKFLIKLYYSILYLFCVLIMPTLLGMIIYSIQYFYYNNINYSYKKYILSNIISEWLFGFIILLLIIHIWARREAGQCRLNSDW